MSAFKLMWKMLLIIGIAILSSGNAAYAVSNMKCLGASMLEFFLPGVGYVYLDQYDKAVLLGGGRWTTLFFYQEAVRSEEYQGDNDKIYQRTSSGESETGEEELRVFLNKETWQAEYNMSLNTNLLLISLGDMYMNRCQPNFETYKYMFSPIRIDHFFDNWMFWFPMALLAAFPEEFAETSGVEYFLERGLSSSDIFRDSGVRYYTVGVGEEMISRGTIQNFFFEKMKNSWGWNPQFSRHASVLAAAAVFAAGHSGEGHSTDASGAFFMGIYLGYTYHPSLEEFDLMTAIALHSWWDMMIMYIILKNAEFYENQEDVYKESNSDSNASSKTKLLSSTRFPLFNISFSF